jgi:tyrosinase
MTVHLGPMSATVGGVPANPRADGLGYNPRCLRRDISKTSAAATAATYTYNLITKFTDILSFQNVMQGSILAGSGLAAVGVHSGGHFTIGGDPGGVSSP